MANEAGGDGSRRLEEEGTRPVWRERVESEPAAPLRRDLVADVCVVGAGIAGLTTAYRLSGEGRRVVVLEALEAGAGESGRTTAHLSSAIDDRYHRLIAWRGREVARVAWQTHAYAVDTIESIARDEEIECDFRRLPGYLVLPEGGSREALEHERDAVRSLGIGGVEWIERLAIAGYDHGPALAWSGQAQFHVLRYLNGLLRALRKRGGVLHGGTRVRELRGAGPFQVATEEGFSVRAAHVVLATNAPLDSPAEVYLREFPYRTYVVGLTVAAGAFPPALLWDDGDPYHYVRRMEAIGDMEGDLLIVGGEDHPTGRAHDMERRWGALETWARERFPIRGERRFQWSGQVFETVDGLGLIGRCPGRAEGAYMISGDSGMGMTHGTLGALLVSDLILGRSNPWVDVYDPGRAPVRAAAEFVREAGPAAVEIARTPFAGERAEFSAVAPGTGRVLRVGGDTVAAYRDERGRLTLLSATCTHRGCALSWNEAERSWDCGCHGSRFDVHGRVIQSPAVERLEPYEEKRERRTG